MQEEDEDELSEPPDFDEDGGSPSDFDGESNAGDGDSLESDLDDESGTDNEGSLMILEENVAYLIVCQILFQLE